MKSLEIVVEKIEHEKEILNELKRCHVNNGFIEEEEKIIEKYQKIQQSLEVLEIIREKKVDILALECRINTFKDDNERILHSYNAMFYNKKIYKLTMEELLKLKKWLEVNKCETKEIK